ncbi:MAG: GNAT family N-acetyltransferase [Bacteroidales bacterium]|nr:GNAT family N-acetyltransferase [Bacteroidales bacterium]
MLDNCRIVRLTSDYAIKSFDCGNADLNDFLQNDAKAYANHLLAVTYLLENDTELFAFFSVSNDRISINESDKATWRRIKQEFPHSKHRSDYPAVKIGRLGVNVTHQNEHLGRLIINFVKDTFITNNRTGCAFITVDALKEAIPFYQKNGFKLLKPSEPDNSGKETVPMYYDLTQLL